MRTAGLIDLKKTDWRDRATEIGYWAALAARGRGVLTEATVAFVTQGVDRGGLRTGNPVDRPR